MGFLVGRGLTVVHFFLSWELTSTTLRSLAHLRRRDRKPVTSGPASRGKTLRWQHSRVSRLGRAILLVFVSLAELAVPPALATNKHHLHIRRPELPRWAGKRLMGFK